MQTCPPSHARPSTSGAKAVVVYWPKPQENEGVAGKVASALALLALLRTKLARSARVRTIKHRHERWRPLEWPQRAAQAATKECFGERTTKPVSRDPPKIALSGLRALCTLLHAATVHAAII